MMIPSGPRTQQSPKVAVVVMNRGDKEVKYNLWVAGNAAEVTNFPHSISDAGVLTASLITQT